MRRVYVMVLVALLSVWLAGCAQPGKVTGGGWMHSLACMDETDGPNCGKANFGFNADSCEGLDSVFGHFNFHDIKAPQWADDGGVKINGYVVEAAECVDFDPDIEVECVFCNWVYEEFYDDGCGYGTIYMVNADYRSTNPKLPGEGRVLACVLDNGEGVNASESDMAVVKITSGPFGGYFNYGYVRGNIQAHECEE